MADIPHVPKVIKDTTKPGTNKAVERKEFSNLLPSYLRTDTNKKVLSTILDFLMSNGNTRQYSQYYGRAKGGYHTATQDEIANLLNEWQKNYSFSPGWFSQDPGTKEIQLSLTQDDAYTELKRHGVNDKDWNDVFEHSAYSWSPPIDHDKFINYEQYYWINWALVLDVPTLGSGGSVINEITANVTTREGVSVALETGMGLKNLGNFHFKVSGVGDSIRLDERQAADIITRIGTTREQHEADYITIGLGATNGNPWSRSNYWMHEDTLKAMEIGCAWSASVTYAADDIVSRDGEFRIAKQIGGNINQDPLSDNTLTYWGPGIKVLDPGARATRPIIEFNKDIEIYNHGFDHAAEVGHITSASIADIVGKSSYSYKSGADDVSFGNGQSVLFINSTTDINNKMYTIGGVGSAITLTGEKTFTTGQSVLTHKRDTGTSATKIYMGSRYHFNGTTFVTSQQKTARGQAPLFNLYDKDNVLLDNTTKYPDSNFAGSNVFTYATDTTGTTDTELNFNPVIETIGLQVADLYASNNDYVFDWDQSKKEYQYKSNNVVTEIAGIYYTKIGSQYQSGWHESNYEAYTPVIQDIEVGSTTSDTRYSGCVTGTVGLNGKYEIDTGTNTPYYSREFYVHFEGNKFSWFVKKNGRYHQIPAEPNETNPKLYFPSGKDITINYYSEIEGFKITDPTGTVPASGITNNNATSGTITINIDKATYPVLRYNAYPTSTVYGEIYLFDEKQEHGRPLVYRNGIIQKEGTQVQAEAQTADWYLSGSKITFPFFTTEGSQGRTVTFDSVTGDYIIPSETSNELLEVTTIQEKDVINIEYYIDEPRATDVWDDCAPLTKNPNWENPASLSYGKLYKHFTTCLRKQPLLEGASSGKNNSRNIRSFNTIPGTILQYKNPALISGLILDNPFAPIMQSIFWYAQQYEVFKFKLLNAFDNAMLGKDYTLLSHRELLDDALIALTKGKTKGFSFSLTNHVAYKGYTEKSYVGDGTTTAFALPTGCTYGTTPTSQNIEIYVNDTIQLLGTQAGYNYTISSNTINFRPDSIPANEKIILIRYADAIEDNFIPHTPASLGINRLFKPCVRNFTSTNKSVVTHALKMQALNNGPRTIKIHDGFNYFIQGHDGSMYPVSDQNNLTKSENALLEFERRIYNQVQKYNTFDTNGIYHLSITKDLRQTAPKLIRKESGAIWQKLFNIDPFEFTFDVTDKFRVNYNDLNNSGHALGLIKEKFGTSRPDIEPWRILGYQKYPEWWETYYTWKDTANGGDDTKRANLITAIQAGHYNSPGDSTKNFDSRYAIDSTIVGNIVSVTGELQDPVTAGIISPASFNTLSKGQLVKNYVWNDYGPVQNAYDHSSFARFVEVLEFYVGFANEYAFRYFDSQKFNTSGTNITDIDGGRTTFTNYITNGEVTSTGTVTKQIGIQNLLFEFMLSQGKDNTLFGKTLRNLQPHILCKTNNFIIDNRTAIKLPISFNLQSGNTLPEENQHIFLYESPATERFVYSQIKVTKVATGFKLSTYDTIGREIKYYAPKPAVISTDVVSASKIQKKRYTTTETILDTQVVLKNNQEVVDVLRGIYNWYEASGIAMDKSSDAVVKQYIVWGEVTQAIDNNVTVSFSTSKITVTKTSGTVLLDRELGYQHINGFKTTGGIIKDNDVEVFRTGHDFEITHTADVGCLYFKICTYEHVIAVDNTTQFNDIVYSPLLGIKQPRVRISTIGLLDWTGRLTEPGYMIKSNTIEPNIETSVKQISTDYFAVEQGIANEELSKALRYNIGYSEKEFLRNINTDNDVSFEFYRGYIQNKGTNENFNRLQRNKNTLYNDSNSVTSINEEWMIKEDDFGSTRENETLEFVVQPRDFNQERQLIEFSKYRDPSNKDLKADTKIEILANDARWVWKPTDLSTGAENWWDDYTSEIFRVTVSKIGLKNVFQLDGVVRPILVLNKGKKYRFDSTDSSVDNDALLFSTTPNGTHNSGTTYSTTVKYFLEGVEKNKADYLAGHSTATSRYIEVVPTSDTGDRLYYYSNSNSDMGMTLIITNNEYGFNTDIFYDRAMYTWNMAEAERRQYTRWQKTEDPEGDLPYSGYALLSEADHYVQKLTDIPDLYSKLSLTSYTEWSAASNYNKGDKVRYKGKLWEAQLGMTSYDGKSCAVKGADQSGDTITVDGLTQKPLIGTLLTWVGADVDETVPTQTHHVEEVENWDATAGSADLVIYPQKVTKSSDNASITLNVPTPALWIIDGTGYEGFYLDEPNWLAVEDTLGNSRIWVNQYDDKGWNILQLMDYDNTTFTSQTTTATLEPTNAIIEICKGVVTGDEAQIQTKGNHNLKKGDYVVITGVATANTNVNGIHKVIGFPTGSNNDGSLRATDHFLIDEYASETSTITEGKMFAFKPTRFQTTAQLTATTSNAEYFWRDGAIAYVDYDATYRGWAVYQHNRLHALTVFLKYNADNYQEAVNKCYGWGPLSDSTLGQPVIRYQQSKIDERNIDRVILYNGDTNKKLAECELYDPFKGIIPGEADKNIDYKSLWDPANYSNSTDTTYTGDDTTHWATEKEGLIWWDLNNVGYIEYEQSTLTYRNNYWGKEFPASSIDVYEWTKSSIDPEAWSATAEGTVKDDIEVSGTPYSITVENNTHYYYTVEDEIDANGDLKTYYYFWVKNKTYAINANKSLSTFDIARYIKDPTNMGVKWCAPIAPNALTIANVEDLIETNTVVQVRFNISEKSTHDEWQTIYENDSSEKLPEKYKARLLDNLIGFSSDYSTHLIWTLRTDYSALYKYNSGDVVMANNQYWEVLIDHMGGNISTALSANKVKLLQEADSNGTFNKGDTVLYSANYYECFKTHNLGEDPGLPGSGETGTEIPEGVWYPWTTINASTNFASYVAPATTSFAFQPWKIVYDLEDTDVEVITASANTNYKKRNKRLELPDTALHPYARYGNEIRPRQSWFKNRAAAKREFIDGANVILKEINIVDNVGYWRTTGTIVLDMQKTTYTKGLHTYNPTTYWQYIDWQDSSVTVESSSEIVADEATFAELDATTYTINSIIEISDDGSGRREWFQVQKIGDTQKFVLVKKENATIEILDTLWQTSSTGYDSDIFDFYGFDNDAEVEFEIIANDLLLKIFSKAYESRFNTMFFNMLRYVLQEQNFVPWMQKTSENKFRLVSKGDIQPGSYNVENTQNTIDYYNETKPYHSKLDKELFSKHMFDMQNITLSEIDGRAGTYGNALTHVANIQIMHGEVDSYVYEYTMVEDLHPSRPGRDLDYVKIPWNDFTSTMGGTTISWNPGSAIIAVYVNGTLRDASTYEDMYMVDGRVVNFNSKLTAGDKVNILFNITKKYSEGNLHPEGVDISTNSIGGDYIGYANASFTEAEPATIFDGDAFTTLTDPTDIIDASGFYTATAWNNWNNEMIPSFLRETVEIRVQSNHSGSTVITGSTWSATRSWKNIIQDRENHQRFMIIEDKGITLSGNITADATELIVSSTTGIVGPTIDEQGGVDNVFYLDYFPGRIWIDNECIEFDKMIGSTFYNLRRGMLGTSAVAHTSGAKVKDANKLKEISVNRWESTNPLISAPNQRNLGFPRIPQWNDLGARINNSTNDLAIKLKGYHGTIT